MQRIVLLGFVFVGVLGVGPEPPTTVTAAAVKWQFRKQSTSNNCVVQTADSQPVLGELISEHDTRKSACEAARDRYDSTLSDSAKCWTYGPGTKNGCAAEGIPLPPE